VLAGYAALERSSHDAPLAAAADSPGASEAPGAPAVSAAPRVAAKPLGAPVPRAAAALPRTPDEQQLAEERALERELAQQPTYTIAPPGSPASGMALFPAPGTSPVLRGIVVPDDFPLPEGYVRHHQVTDEGEALPPILMFHPDYDWLDRDGAPIELPADLVVPPELAPEGMPIEQLAPPAGSSGAGSSS